MAALSGGGCTVGSRGIQGVGRDLGCPEGLAQPHLGLGEMAEEETARKGVMGVFRSVGRGDGGQEDCLEKG